MVRVMIASFTLSTTTMNATYEDWENRKSVQGLKAIIQHAANLNLNISTADFNFSLSSNLLISISSLVFKIKDVAVVVILF